MIGYHIHTIISFYITFFNYFFLIYSLYTHKLFRKSVIIQFIFKIQKHLFDFYAKMCYNILNILLHSLRQVSIYGTIGKGYSNT